MRGVVINGGEGKNTSNARRKLGMSFHLQQGSNPRLPPLISQSLLYFQMRAAVVVVAAAVAAVALGEVWMGFAIKPCAAFCEPLLLLKIISGKKPGFGGLRDQKSCVCVCVIGTLQSNGLSTKQEPSREIGEVRRYRI